jgi:hypothetical protein
VWGVWGSRPLLTFDIPQTALVAILDIYDFIICNLLTVLHESKLKKVDRARAITKQNLT